MATPPNYGRLQRSKPIGIILVFSILIAIVLVAGNIARPVLADSSPVSLEGISDQGTFKVQLQWNTSAIGNVNQFNITFRDNSTGTVIEDVHYDWRVSAESGLPASVVKPDQNSTTQLVVFPHAGPYRIIISNIEGLGEGIDFPIQVTPEIPSPDIGAAIAGAIIMTMASSNNLFRHRTRI